MEIGQAFNDDKMDNKKQQVTGLMQTDKMSGDRLDK